MRFPRGPIVLGLALCALVGVRAGAARADDPKPDDKKPADAPKKPAKKAPAAAEAIAWRLQWTEAVEEARERNVLVMIHSHAST